MAITARLDTNAMRGGKPRNQRHAIRLETSGATPSGDAAAVTIHNVSATGVLLETAVDLQVGDPLSLELPEGGSHAMRVVWTSGALHGCAFEDALPKAVLSATLLRAATGGLQTARSSSTETFTARLKRLRLAAGLSLADVAAALGVSKPTVWAWEQGRSRPGSERIAGLANVLNTDPADLLAGRNEGALRDTLARCRAEVAHAYDVAPESVTIAIELKD